MSKGSLIGLAAKKSIRTSKVFFFALGGLKLNSILPEAHFKNASASSDMKLGLGVLLSQAAAQGCESSGGRERGSKLSARNRKGTENADPRKISDGMAVFHAASRTEGKEPLQGSLCTQGRWVA
jgi:hypothetical protein